MFLKDVIALDIGSTYIKIMVGNKKSVTNCGLIKTPENSVMDDKIINAEAVKTAISEYLSTNNIKAKGISFSVHGQDISIRHTEVPIMDEKGVMNSVQWDASQNLPKDGEDYYIDYEIIDRVSSPDKKIFKLLVVAVPKVKINQYLKIANMLNLELQSIDITANCACRVFKNVYNSDKSIESIGIIDIGNKNSNFTIIDKGKLFIEREIPFGISNILKEIVKRENINSHEAYKYFTENFSLTGNEEGTDTEKRIMMLLENAFSSFEKVIQFYVIGKSKRSLHQIYLIGGGSNIPGLSEYAGNYFNCPVNMVNSVSDLGLKTKLPSNCEHRFYISTLGLLLRKE
ncbi:pilus assembly protein PilM [Clostridium sp. JN-9]|uniref:pilus assembly protein PilM n=1 Tax=Clostridium sp. JN-9 TaxID=2507159 RepID=UPI000FFE120F|nr:pilus assembly protein PilM [Clostridium sp. JN-9]QAT41173.1 cell division protein FtsA [Clostridium sp. JN-9]